MGRETIAVDIDEVLFPLLESFLHDHNPKYDTDHSVKDFLSYEWEHTLGIPLDGTVSRVYDYLDGSHELVEAVEGSQDAIAHLAQDYNLVVITARHPRFEENTTSWVNRKFEKVFSKIVCIGYAPLMAESAISKAEVCKELGATAMIDDSLVHVSHCADAEIKGILFGNYPGTKLINYLME